MTATAIVGGQLIDGAGHDPVQNGLVLIEGDRITYAGPRDARPLPRDAVVIDAASASVLPGLMDMHVHISLCAPVDMVGDTVVKRPLAATAFEVVANLRTTVAAGVTTIRTVSDIGHLDIAARDAVRRGLVVGPRVFPCGKGITRTGGHGQLVPHWLCTTYGDICEVVDGVDAIRAAVRRQVQAGADWIKVFQTGGVIDPAGRIEDEEFAADELEAAIGTARMSGRPVAVHAHNKAGILRSIASGCRSIEHGMSFDDECARAARDRDVFLVPTLTVMERIVRLGEEAGIPFYMIQNVLDRTDRHRKYVQIAHEMGVPVATGTDAGSLLTPHGMAGREVVMLTECGLSPVAAICAGTLMTARLLGVEDRLGTLAAGKLADVLVVDGDVIADVRALEDGRRMRHVLVNGRRVAAGGIAVPV
jgi:imidazolonepropionase-like amidohydrolase